MSWKIRIEFALFTHCQVQNFEKPWLDSLESGMTINASSVDALCNQLERSFERLNVKIPILTTGFTLSFIEHPSLSSRQIWPQTWHLGCWRSSCSGIKFRLKMAVSRTLHEGWVLSHHREGATSASPDLVNVWWAWTLGAQWENIQVIKADMNLKSLSNISPQRKDARWDRSNIDAVDVFSSQRLCGHVQSALPLLWLPRV